MGMRVRTRHSRVSEDKPLTLDSSSNFRAVVSRAFQILSDSDKKARYDKFGGDPDSRFNPGASASSGASPFSGGFGGGFPRSGGGGPTFEEEISPEELFNRFFNGGFGGMGPMGGGFSPFGKAVPASNPRSQLTLSRWPSICLQYGRWSRVPCAPIWRAYAAPPASCSRY